MDAILLLVFKLMLFTLYFKILIKRQRKKIYEKIRKKYIYIYAYYCVLNIAFCQTVITSSKYYCNNDLFEYFLFISFESSKI